VIKIRRASSLDCQSALVLRAQQMINVLHHSRLITASDRVVTELNGTTCPVDQLRATVSAEHIHPYITKIVNRPLAHAGNQFRGARARRIVAVDVPQSGLAALLRTQYGVLVSLPHHSTKITKTSTAGHISATAFDLGLSPLLAAFVGANHVRRSTIKINVTRWFVTHDTRRERSAHLIYELAADCVIPKEGEILIIKLHFETT